LHRQKAVLPSHKRKLEQHPQHRRLVILNTTQSLIPRLCRSNAKLHLIGLLMDDRVEMLLVLHFTISLHFIRSTWIDYRKHT